MFDMMKDLTSEDRSNNPLFIFKQIPILANA